MSLTVTAGALLTVAAAACSSSATPSAASASHSASASAGTGSAHKGYSKNHIKGNVIRGLISFRGSYSLTGAKQRHSSFTAFPGVLSPESSCARLASQGNPVPSGQKSQFRIPAPPPGSPVYFLAEIMNFHGPGTYDKGSLVGEGASLVIGDASYRPLAPGASASVTLRANGSGIFTFRHAVASHAAGGFISGSVQWTCSD